MKKRKITYSMSARQKRELQRKQENNNKEDEEKSDEDVAVRPKKKGLIVAVTAGALAIALIIVALCIPALTVNGTITNDTFLKWSTYNPDDPENPYNDENPNPAPPANPIVTFTLYSENKEAFKSHFGADEITIGYELFIDDAPYACINMMYLAESGFYDGTIINDINKGYAMINGFTDIVDGKNKAKDLEFVSKMTGFGEDKKSQWDNSGFKLGYRFTAETARRTDDSFGYLVMLSGQYSSSMCTSTGYVLITRDSPQFDDLGNYMSWAGKLAADDKGENQSSKLVLLNSVPTEPKGDFKIPQFTIKIKSARTDLSSAHRKYLLNNFESIISKEAEKNGWKTYSYSSSDYKFSS